jgi:GDP-mannose 6-dehydrogenase
MKILVWGLGCCGLVNAACLAEIGHDVIGVDRDKSRIEALNSGECDIEEPGLKELLRAIRRRTTFISSADGDLIGSADASLICVGTPDVNAAGLDTKQVEDVIKTITALMAGNLHRFHTVIVRSTTNVGFLRGRAQPILEGGNLGALGVSYGLATLPEFLREGKAIEDFKSPAFAIAGCLDRKSEAILTELHLSVDAHLHLVTAEEAETLKLVNNSFHALKAAFANEVGRFCAPFHVNPERIMELVCEDNRLNISAAYLSPGPAFGGSCLPKDVQALLAHAKSRGVTLPLLERVLPSNRNHIELWVQAIGRHKGRRVGLLGLSFKAGTNDLRNSPALTLAKHLTQKGYELLAYDPDIRGDRLNKRNADLLTKAFGDASGALVETTSRVVQESDIVAVLHSRPEFQNLEKLAAPAKTTVLDFSDPQFAWLSASFG